MGQAGDHMLGLEGRAGMTEMGPGIGMGLEGQGWGRKEPQQ